MATPGARSCTAGGRESSRPFWQRQGPIVVPLAHDVRLVSLETVRAARGARADAIVVLAEDHLSPQHLPAFDLNGGDVSGGGAAEPRRELRFWAGALEGSNNWRKAPSPETLLDRIIADCVLTDVEGLGNRAMHLPSSRLIQAWCISSQTMFRLIHSGKIKAVQKGQAWRVNRFSAAEFLRSRAL